MNDEGSLTVTLLDEQSQPLSGFSPKSLKGDVVSAALDWDLSALSSKLVRRTSQRLCPGAIVETEAYLAANERRVGNFFDTKSPSFREIGNVTARSLTHMDQHHSSSGTREKLSETIRLACIWEATAPKPGNVHPDASFADLTFEDFVKSAEAVGPVLARARELGVGRAVFESIRATRTVVKSNTNLGIVLLLAPLAAVATDRPLQDGIGDVLSSLSRDDAAWVYRAIRLAQPGGLGSTDAEDVSREPTGTLLEVMKLAADRDGVAAQYANQFAWVLDEGLSFLKTRRTDWPTVPLKLIIELQLRLLVRHPDTLIARKCGVAEANEASRQAQVVLDAGSLETATGRRLLSEFDGWLREDSNRRNPGTTADLVTTCLFAALRDGIINSPEFESK